MKARWVIFGVFLLAVAVSPAAMRAVPLAPAFTSPPTTKFEIHTNYARHKHQSLRKVISSLPGHRPATRLHRIRGKKLSIERAMLKAQGSSTPSRYVFSIAQVRPQNSDGPNPSRGPPASSL
jgi:hypothetical protein